MIPNALLRDDRMSYAARGALAALFSHADDWDGLPQNADEMSDRARRSRPGRAEGRRATRAVVAEWIANGYAERVKAHDGKTGHWSTELHVYDVPVTGHRDTGSGTSVPPAETGVSAGLINVSRNGHRETGSGTSVPPAETGVSAGRTEVPLTDRRQAVRQVLRRPGPEDKRKLGGHADGPRGLPQTEDQDHSVANSQDRRVHDGPITVAQTATPTGPSTGRRSPAADRNAREPIGGAEEIPLTDFVVGLVRELTGKTITPRNVVSGMRIKTEDGEFDPRGAAPRHYLDKLIREDPDWWLTDR